MLEAIDAGATQLQDLRGLADWCSTPASWSIHEIRTHVFREFREARPHDLARSELMVSLVSFGFKHGIPYGTDLLFDVRFLPNPHFVAELRNQPVRTRPVLEFLEHRTDFEEVVDRLADLLHYLLPRYRGRAPELPLGRRRLHRRPSPVGGDRGATGGPTRRSGWPVRSASRHRA